MKKVFQFSGKKIGSLFLVICMVMTLLPTTAFAEDAVQDSGLLRAATGDVVIQESDSITEIKTAIETALTTNSVVTVTGKKTEVDKSLELSIPSGKTVVWKAEFIAETDPGNFLIYFKDTGTLEIANEAVLSTEGAHTIKVENSAILKIKGGSISSKGDIFSAISAVASDVYIEGGAISADGSTANCRAIFAGSGSNLIINGGDISTTGESAVSVYVTGGSQVTVNGGNIDTSGKSATAFSVFNNSTAEVNNGNISSSGNKGEAIQIESGIDGPCILTVLDGTIQATGTESIALEIYESNVTIENGTIQADGTTSKAIYVRKNGVLTVEDGNIHADGENGTGIQLWGAKNTEIKAATVTAKGAGGKAVLIENSLAPIKIRNGSLIQATTGYAIEYIQNLTIDGGTIFAYGSDIFGKNNVISQTATTSNGSNISGDNLVILAWNQEAGKTSYTKDSTDDIKTYPSGVTAKWANSGEKSGIAYSHGSNSGFIELPVTVREAGDPITVTSIEVETPPTKTLYSAGDSLDLSGLVATLNKSDSSEEDVAFADFGTKGITTSPVNGTVLTTSDTTVTITYTANNKSTTQAIIVNTLAGITTPADLKAALGSGAASTITLGADITLASNSPSDRIDMGASHTLTVPSGKTLTLTGSASVLNIGSNVLSINGGGTVTVTVDNGWHGIFCSGNYATGVLNLGNISVNLQSKREKGIDVATLNVNSGATVNLNSVTGSELIDVGKALTVNSGGVINILTCKAPGILNQSRGTVHINGGTINIAAGADVGISNRDGSLLKYTSGVLGGTIGSVIFLLQDSKVEGVNGIFNDQGTVLAASGQVTIGAPDAAVSENGLTGGTYSWNGTHFKRNAIAVTTQPQDVSVTQGAITGSLTTVGAASNSSAVSYRWHQYKPSIGMWEFIAEATDGSFSIPTSLTEGTYRYQCRLTADGCDRILTRVATVTVNAPGGATNRAVTVTNGTASPVSAATGVTVTLTASAAPSGQRFKEWSIFPMVTFVEGTSKTSSTAKFIMPAQAVIATATYAGSSSGDSGSGTSSGGGGSSGGSSSGGSSTTTTTTPEKKPNQPGTAAVTVAATVGANGAASASIPDKAVNDAIAKAQADVASQGKTANGISVELDVTMPKGATSLMAVLTRSSLDSLVSTGVSSLEINGFLVSVSFDKKALAEIQKQSIGNISIVIVPKTNLSDAAKKMIGTRPVYDITVGYGSGKTVSSFGGGTATVSFPYTPAKGEAVGGLYAVYVDEKGNATRIAGSAYDANSGCVIFTTTHFSQYGIGYTTPSAKFTDISTHWAKESIDYVVGRGLFSGTTETTFAPNTAMTRGMLVTALGRLAGVDTKTYTTNSFTDVKADSAFRPYIEWAYKKGIVQGIGSNQFAPDRAITREEIAVIFANYAKAADYSLPVTRTATTYVDASSIGSTYKPAVTAMQQAGIMMGGSRNKFSPKANATRAEVSSMLHRYIKLTIEPATTGLGE